MAGDRGLGGGYKGYLALNNLRVSLGGDHAIQRPYLK